MRSKNGRSKNMRVIHLWSLPEVEKVLPYMRSVVSSLREHWLNVLSVQRKEKLESKKIHAVKRDGLIAAEEVRRERERAQEKFDDALRELNHIDIFLLDAVRGLALIPFRLGDDLAWYVFDLFTEEGLVGWRFHQDPFEMRRPLDALNETSAAV